MKENEQKTPKKSVIYLIFRNFDKGSMLTSLIVSLSIALMVGYITPLDVALNNQNNFIIGFSDIAGYMLLPAFELFAALFLVLVVCLLLNKSLYKIIKGLLFGVMLSFYIQELFLNGKMIYGISGSVVGDISYNESVINLIIHTEIVLFSTVTVFFNELKRLLKLSDKSKNFSDPSKNDKNFLIKNAVPVILSAMTLMQLTGFVSSYISNNPKNYSDLTKEINLFSVKKTASFSKVNNVYVFIVDRFDSFWCDELLEQYPEMKEELDGFTFYQNNMSHYTHTFPSISSMLTNNVYDNSEWNDYLEKVWHGENALSLLKANGYQVNLLLDKTSTYKSSYLLEPYCDNLEIEKDVDITVNKRKFRKIMFELSMTRMLPYQFKDSFSELLMDVANINYVKYSYEDTLDYCFEKSNNIRDLALYDFSQQAKFDADSDKNVFSVIHLNGAHDPNPKLVKKAGIKTRTKYDYDIYGTLRANFMTILSYIHAAKELGIYDNTTFIILGDHGINPESISNSNFELVSPGVTALLVKPSGTEHGELKFDDHTALSNDMFSASILEYAGLDHSDYGYSFNDIIESQTVLPRKFQTFLWKGTGIACPKEKFIVNGNARDFSNWKKIE